MQEESIEKSENGLRERRRNLLTFLRPNDVLMFNRNGDREYLFVKSIGPTKAFVSGIYYHSSGQVEKRKRISLDRIAEMDPQVAYLRNILLI